MDADEDNSQAGPSKSKRHKHISPRNRQVHERDNGRCQQNGRGINNYRSKNSQSVNREYNHRERGRSVVNEGNFFGQSRGREHSFDGPNRGREDNFVGLNRGRAPTRTNFRDRNQENRGKFIGFKTLQDLAQSDEANIIVNLNAKKDSFLQLIGGPIERNDVFILVIEIISKVCKSAFIELKLKLLLDICNSQFIPTLLKFLMDLPFSENKRTNSLYWNNQLDFWNNFIVFCDCIIKTSPSTALKKCRSLIEAASKSCLESLAERHGFILPEECANQIAELRLKLTSFEKSYALVKSATHGNRNLSQSNINPPDDFRHLSLQPTPADLFENRPFLRPNIVNGGYQDVEHYLDVQFRLMREDCFRPLREGILQYKEDSNRKRYDHIRVHKNVRFLQPYITKATFGSLVQIDTTHRKNRNFKRVNWTYNKRFIYGSLVLFSKDNFQTFMVATILDRDVNCLSEGMIPVSIIDDHFNDDLYNPANVYTMIESEVYYEPYYHVMKVLQDPMFPEHIAMQKYIVHVNPEVMPPAYLTPEVEFVFSNGKITNLDEDYQYIFEMICEASSPTSRKSDKNNPPIKFNVLLKETWPSKELLGFNNSQYEAFELALTNEFAVIQGPPGTGKTYLGINIANTLLHSLKKKNGCLMLVICYTNHALDQFLEAILKTTSSVVRIGGQSKSEAMTNINLNKLRRDVSSISHRRVFLENRFVLKDALKEFQQALIRFDVLNNGIISSKHVKDIREIGFLCEFYNNVDDPLFFWLFQHKNLYDIATIDNILLEYAEAPDEDTFKEAEQRTQYILDDEDNEFDIIEDQEIKASFSVNNAVAVLRQMINDYKKIKPPPYNLEREIRDLYSQIKLFKDMEVYRTRQTNIIINPRTNFDRIHPADRWALYFSWVRPKIEDIRIEIGIQQVSIKEKMVAYEEARMLTDLDIIKSKKVIGMTTSGAARLRKMLLTLKTPIVIVEEAAEVLEQHIVTSLTQHCQHLILIGDHQQLRPSASHVRLARHFNMEVSLFERMITNGVHSRRLSVQHRMRPEIAALISPHIYPDLDNHPSVLSFPDVRGMANNLFFLTHNYTEEEMDENASRTNQKEADLTMSLANYLMQQGYLADEVTILAAYSGQAYYMRKQRQNYSHLNDVKITVVDNYQGEESRIILLSLVRNNTNNNIGFLGTENRICVALSRAKEGFYIFGNIDTLKHSSQLWKNIATTLENNNSLGTSFNLKCQNHQDNITNVKTPEDFEKVPEGGCLLPCHYKMRCGHICLLLCHGYDREHSTVMTKCTKPCERVLCELGHVCPLKCFQKCEPCKVIIKKRLSCGHEKDFYCHVDPERKTIQCYVELTVTLPDCGHEAIKKCYQKIKDVVCLNKCEYRVEKCGHVCLRKCHVNDDPQHEKYQCRKPCSRAMKGCTADIIGDRGDHQCKKSCFEECDNCNVIVMKKRSYCKHTELSACSENLDKKKCNRNCARLMACGHFCKNKCFEPCIDCSQIVTKVIPDCKHEVKIACSIEANSNHCTRKCNKIMSCGHKCHDLCKNKCDPSKCTQRSTHKIKSPCGHEVALPCNISDAVKNGLIGSEIALKYCTAVCGILLDCEHPCSGTCASCHQGRIHQPCTRICGRANICGHECSEPCNKSCPPCNKRCEVRCPHSRCNQLCGVPCVMCKEKCSRKCRHGACDRLCGQPCSRAPCDEPCELQLPCGHRCRGLCGEVCPDICKECRPETFPTGFIGEEFDEHDKFIVLQDCGHVLEMEDMDNLMKADKETIAIRACPFCRKPIINTNRYKDIVNNTFINEINPIKEKIFGNPKEITVKRIELSNKIITYLKTYAWQMNKNMFLKETFLSVAHFERENKRRLSLVQINMLLIYIDILDIITEYYIKYKNENTKILYSEFELQMELIGKVLSKKQKSLSMFKISQREQKDIANEIKRMNAIIQLSKIFNHDSYKSSQQLNSVKFAADEAKSAVFSVFIFDEDLAFKAMKDLEKVIAVSGCITKAERDLIVKAMNMSRGHWFKCPNGHIYAIGDCGGAMVQSKCNECGEAIGGGNHTLLPSNSLASEMDGAQYAAWSERNNLENYRL